MLKCPQCKYENDSMTEIGAHLNTKHRGCSYTPSEIEGNINKSGSRKQKHESDSSSEE